jgi:hypothetical protein
MTKWKKRFMNISNPRRFFEQSKFTRIPAKKKIAAKRNCYSNPPQNVARKLFEDNLTLGREPGLRPATAARAVTPAPVASRRLSSAVPVESASAWRTVSWTTEWEMIEHEYNNHHNNWEDPDSSFGQLFLRPILHSPILPTANSSFNDVQFFPRVLYVLL